jgi:hypothetical protein
MAEKAWTASDEVKLEKRRVKIPAATVRAVHLEAAYQCARPRCRQNLTLDVHHIDWVKDGGGNDESNLLLLCPTCHAKFHRGVYTTEAIWHWKGLLVAMNNAFDRKTMDTLLMICAVPGIVVSGDGLINYASLHAMHLVKFDIASQSAGPVVTTAAKIEPTDRGKMLVDAWNSDDAERYQKLLNTKFPDIPVTNYSSLDSEVES